MCRRAALFALIALSLSACFPFRRVGSPIKCPAEPVRDTNRVIRIDNPPPTRLFNAPFTLILDDRIVAVVRNEADSLAATRALRDLDGETIKKLELVRGTQASDRFPSAVGDVWLITRCY